MSDAGGRPRVPPLAPHERDERQAALVEQAGSELGVYTTLVRNPDLFAYLLPFGQHLLRQSTLDGRVRELLIMRVAWRCCCAYVWSHHEEIGRAEGFTDDDLAALAADAVDDRDALRAVSLRAADELLAEHRLGEATWGELAGRYRTEQLIEICLLVGVYAMLASTLNSLGVQLEDGHAAPGWADR